ncbi:acetyltransferase [Lachnospiraceae bacterium 29-84]
MNERLVIIGASGHGKVVADIAVKMNRYNKIMFLDDDISIKECLGFPVIGTSEDVEHYIRDCDVFVAIGNAKIRQKIQESLYCKGAVIPTLVHPGAIVSNEVSIGEGTIVMAGVIINPGTHIGKGCILNTASSIDHDCMIDDYVHISVGVHLAGTVEIGERTWVGIGAVISNNLKVVSGCVIGAGTVVIRDILKSCTVVGNPAKDIKFSFQKT